MFWLTMVLGITVFVLMISVIKLMDEIEILKSELSNQMWEIRRLNTQHNRYMDKRI